MNQEAVSLGCQEAAAILNWTNLCINKAPGDGGMVIMVSVHHRAAEQDAGVYRVVSVSLNTTLISLLALVIMNSWDQHFLLLFACDAGFESSSAPRTLQTVEQHRAPSLQSEEDDEEEEEEEEGSNLIRPRKPLSPLKASKSHRELHKELRMTHTRSGRRRAS